MAGYSPSTRRLVMTNYIVATVKDWNIKAFKPFAQNIPGEWHLVHDPVELTVDIIRNLQPRYIFFPHWSWKISEQMRELSECVIFHMTDLPYGRGGSPLQNLIQRGHVETVIAAIRAEEEMDAGPIYLKKPLSLSGNAQEIFERATEIIYTMIEEIVRTEPSAKPQSGAPEIFQRRTPSQSALPLDPTSEELYDHIRMLDADSYPRAFIDFGSYKLEFSDAEIIDGEVSAKVRFCKQERA